MPPAPVPTPPPASAPHRAVEAAIVGGGPAGLSAALVLGRARREVVVIDDARPAHFASEAVHGFLGQEGVSPRDLRRTAWRQLGPFAVSHAEGRVVKARGPRVTAATPDPSDGSGPPSADEGFVLTLGSGETIAARTVLLAGGLGYGVQPVEGLAELWGTKLLHCPFCHGWEVRGRRAAVIAPPALSGHFDELLRLWIDDLRVFAAWDEAAPEADLVGQGVPPTLLEAEEHRLAEHAGPVDRPVVERVHRDGDEAVVVSGSGEERFDVLFAPPVLTPVDDIPEQLGLERFASTKVTADAVGLKADPCGATAVPGLFAAGDLVNDVAAVALAVAGGSTAGSQMAQFLAPGVARAARSRAEESVR